MRIASSARSGAGEWPWVFAKSALRACWKRILRPTGLSSSASCCSTSLRNSLGRVSSTLPRWRRSAPVASSRPRRRATSSRMALGTTSSTSPSLRAFWARTDLPARIRSSACAIPIGCGTRCVPPAPGISPSCTSGWPSCVFRSSVAIRYVAASASSRPPPRAGPWMAATTGFCLPRSSRRCIACCPPRASAVASMAVFSRASISTSAPTMKLSRFADTITIAFTAESPASFPKTSSKSCWKVSRSVFTGSPGTSYRTVATPSGAVSTRSARSLGPLQDRGGAQSAGGADGDQRGVLALLLQLPEGLVHQASSRRGEWVAERDAAAARVELLVRHLSDRLRPGEVFVGELLRPPGLQVREHLRGEGLVDLHQVDVAQLHAGALQRLGRRERRRLQELPGRIDGRIGIGAQEPERAQPQLAGAVLGADDQRPGAVGRGRGVARRDRAVLLVEDGLELAVPLELRVLADDVVLGHHGVEVLPGQDAHHLVAELACVPGLGGEKVRPVRPRVLRLARDAVLLGHLLRGLAHREPRRVLGDGGRHGQQIACAHALERVQLLHQRPAPARRHHRLRDGARVGDRNVAHRLPSPHPPPGAMARE